MGDPNWLYSSIVQSSAAIVAILGGFITASILGRLSNLDDLKSQLDIVQRRKELAQSRREQRFNDWSTERILDAVESGAPELLKDHHREINPVEARLVIKLPPDIPQELFEREWKSYQDEIEDLIANFEEADQSELPRSSEGFLDWTERNGLEFEGRRKWVAEALFDHVRQQRK